MKEIESLKDIERQMEEGMQNWFESMCVATLLSEKDTVYISGPMRNYPFLNFPAFFAMEAWLRDVYKCKVLNPARNEPGLTLEQYTMIDLAMVRASSAIVMLNGWKKSEGATAEWYEAVKNEIRVIEEDEFEQEVVDE